MLKKICCKTGRAGSRKIEADKGKSRTGEQEREACINRYQQSNYPLSKKHIVHIDFCRCGPCQSIKLTFHLTGETYNDETGMHEKVFADGPAVEVELI